MSATNYIADRIIKLPSYEELLDEDVIYIANALSIAWVAVEASEF